MATSTKKGDPLFKPKKYLTYEEVVGAGNYESLLFFHLSKSGLYDQIRDQTAPGLRTSH